MDKIDVVKPPKVSVPGKGGFWKQIGMMVLGTTISLALTITVAALMEKNQRAKDRHLSALMVMSNIEGFARTLEIRSDKMANNDSVATWLLAMPPDELELLPEKELSDLIDRSLLLAYLARDKSAENVFSNNIETWKNVGNVNFIDLVGSCFSAMDGVLERYNDWVKTVIEAKADVTNNPDKYEGSSIASKMMHSDRVRAAMAEVHRKRGWLKYAAATLRHFNLKNMQAIGITEQELLDYIKEFEEQEINVGDPPISRDFYTDPYSFDSLTTMSDYTARIEELKAEKENKK